MALINRATPQRTTASPVPAAESCRSLGMKALFELLDPERRYRFLDLGHAVGSNIEFLSRLSSRIRVEGLYEALAALRFFERQFERPEDEPPDDGLLERMLPPHRGETYDVILSWDLLNYFRPDEVRMLVRCFERLCTPGSLVFAIISTRKEMPVVPMRFKILDTETLLYTPDSSDIRPCPRYAPRDLGIMMSGFHAHSSYLLRNGMQEYLFVHD